MSVSRNEVSLVAVNDMDKIVGVVGPITETARAAD